MEGLRWHGRMVAVAAGAAVVVVVMVVRRVGERAPEGPLLVGRDLGHGSAGLRRLLRGGLQHGAQLLPERRQTLRLRRAHRTLLSLGLSAVVGAVAGRRGRGRRANRDRRSCLSWSLPAVVVVVVVVVSCRLGRGKVLRRFVDVALRVLLLLVLAVVVACGVLDGDLPLAEGGGRRVPPGRIFVAVAGVDALHQHLLRAALLLERLDGGDEVDVHAVMFHLPRLLPPLLHVAFLVRAVLIGLVRLGPCSMTHR